MTECHHCGVVYEVRMDDDFDDAEVNYCPACGTDVHDMDELDFTD